MNRIKSMAAITAAVALFGGGANGALAQGDSPVTLRFAVADAEGRPSDPYVHAFMDAVAERSGGTVTLEPIWNAAGDAFEQGVAHMLVDGQVELALAAGRGWDDTGIASMQALQAPFLITDDALALAVATSPVAADMLAGMATKGITGLTLWPEDLRHPFAFEPCSGPILTPSDFKGRTIRSIPSAATWDLLRTLGATPIFINGGPYGDQVERCQIQGAESGLLQGTSLPGTPTATGDVTFYPKYQVLAGNSAALGRLSDAQRVAIADAAVAVRDQAIADHPSEADAAAQWCADGGRVVLAGPDAVTAFEAAAQPVFDRMAADEVSAAAIEGIRGLAATIKPAAGAQACAPEPVLSAAPRAAGTPTTLPPDGVWRVSLTHEDLVNAGANAGNAGAGTFTWTFGGGQAHLDVHYDGGIVEQCDANLQPSSDLVLFTYTSGSDCANEIDSIGWSLDDAGLHLSLVDIQNTGDVPFNHAYLEAKPWTRVE